MTSEDREDVRRVFGVVVEDLLSKVQQVAEGVTANGEAIERFHGEFDTFREDTTREFAAVRAEAAAGFAAVRSEAKAFREATAREFAAVHRDFAELRTEIRSSHKDFDRRLKTVETRHASRR